MSTKELDKVHRGLDPTGWLPGYPNEELRANQLRDPDLAEIIIWLENGHDPTQAELGLSGACTKHYWQLRKQLRFKKGVLFFQWEDPLEPSLLLVVPHSMKEQVLKLSHDSKDAGHVGERNTYQKVKHGFYWYRMRTEIENYVRTCRACNLNKMPRKYKKAPMKKYHAGSPMERVHVDVLGPMNKTPQGNTLILMVVDQFTKWVECYPLPDQTAERVARVVVDEFISRFGCPLSLHTDQGTNFTSNLFLEVCRLLQITKTRTTAYRPQSNGQVERMNRDLIQMIRCLQLKNIKHWDMYLPQLSGAMRATVNRNTGYTANMLMLGREVNKPADIMFGIADANFEPKTEGEHATHIVEVMREAHITARECLKQSQLRQKKDYDVALSEANYDVGDLVYLLDPRTKTGVSRKLQSIYSGPYLVTKVISSVLFKIKGRRREVVIHHDRIVPCSARDVPLWMRRMRQTLLNDEDVIASQEEEEEEEEQTPDLSPLYDDTPSDEEEDESASEEDIQEEEVQEPPESESKSRTGRLRRPNTRFHDYVLE